MKASGTRGLTLGSKFSARAAVGIDLDYSALIVKIQIFSSKLWIYSISSQTLGYHTVEPKASDMVGVNFTRAEVQWLIQT